MVGLPAGLGVQDSCRMLYQSVLESDSGAEIWYALLPGEPDRIQHTTRTFRVAGGPPDTTHSCQLIQVWTILERGRWKPLYGYSGCNVKS